MKKGKTTKINGFRSSKVLYGTVDSKEFKSLYLNLQTWVEPKDDYENWSRIVLNMNRSIKHSIFDNLDKTLFDDKYIVDLDLRISGLRIKKKSFMNLEINLFLNVEIDFKSPKLKKALKKIIKEIYSDVLTKNEYFKFCLTKNGNTKVIKVKTETE
jgi:hypothetical protein|tara:strand:- start:2725 stop:3192 length:468 start_codon:yes stop_codon:yes gene_type:complete